MIKRPSIKLPTAIKIPTKSVTPSTPWNSGLDEMKKGVRSRQLPIIEFPMSKTCQRHAKEPFWKKKKYFLAGTLGLALWRTTISIITENCRKYVSNSMMLAPNRHNFALKSQTTCHKIISRPIINLPVGLPIAYYIWVYNACKCNWKETKDNIEKKILALDVDRSSKSCSLNLGSNNIK